MGGWTRDAFSSDNLSIYVTKKERKKIITVIIWTRLSRAVGLSFLSLYLQDITHRNYSSTIFYKWNHQPPNFY